MLRMSVMISLSVADPGLMRFGLLLGLLQTLQCQLTGRSVGLQYTEQSALALRVAEPLKNGLSSFNTVSEMILSENTEIISTGSQTFTNIRQLIEQMKGNLEESEQMVSADLKLLDEKTEKHTAEKNLLERQKERREFELEGLNIKLMGCKSSRANYNGALEKERRNLNSAERTLADMRKKRDEAEDLRNAGIGFMFIPVIGWIPGLVMIGVGQSDLNSASKQVDRARTEVQNCQSHVNFYSQQVSSYERQIKETQADIQKAKNRISEAWVKLGELSVKRSMVADLQAKTRRAIHHVGLLCGVGSVTELQTRRLILLEPMMKVMEEMLAALGQITGDDLLHNDDMRRITSVMRINHRRLVADKCKNASDEDYYCYS